MTKEQSNNAASNGRVVTQPALVHLTDRKLRSSAILAAKFLTEGRVVALPTDTVYGIAALVQDKGAVQKLYTIKGRNFSKPIAICVSEIRDVFEWGDVTVPLELLNRLLPGPVTLAFERKPELNQEFNPGAPLVAIRIPDHPFIRAVCRKVQPLALTSANVSATDSTLEVGEFEVLFPQLAAVFDGGRLGDTPEARLGSTIVDLSKRGHYKITRDGCAKQETVRVLREFDLKEW